MKAQKVDSTIVIDRYFLSSTYTFQGEQLTLQGVSKVVRNNREAYSLIKEARRYKVMGNLLGISGALALGYTMVSLFGIDQEVNNSIALLGVGGVALSIPLNITAGTKARKSVKIYNAGLQPETSSLDLRLGASANGVKLVLSF